MPTATATKSAALVEIERLGFGHTEIASFELSRLDTKRRVQVRESEHYAPKERVEQYAIQMAEAIFPPIIVTEDDWVIDGNTRVQASLKRGQKFFPAIVLDVSWGTASSKRKRELAALAATLNAHNGQPLTARERRQVTEDLISLGWKSEQIARAIGVGQGTVTQVKQEIDAVARLKAVGLSNGHMNGASLRALGKQPVMMLNDEPYKELADLAMTAGLNASEINGIAKQAKATGSDQAALESLAQVRAEMGNRIRDHALTGVSKPPMSRQLRQHLGFVNRFAGEEVALIETNRDVIPQHIDAIRVALDVLQKVLDAQVTRG